MTSRAVWRPCCFFYLLVPSREGMRGAALALALVGLGLAFFIEVHRSRILGAVGALLIGTAVASHALDGSFGMALAASMLLIWAAKRDSRALIGSCYLMGAALIGAPGLLVDSQIPLPYPVLPLIQVTGLAVIALTTRIRMNHECEQRSARWFNLSTLAALGALVLWRHFHQDDGVLAALLRNSPTLAWIYIGGLVVMVRLWFENPELVPYGGIVGFALLIGIGAQAVVSWIGSYPLSFEQWTQTFQITGKLTEYWYPYFLALGGGVLFGWLYQRISAPLTFLAMTVLLMYPWHRVANPVYSDANQYSIPELWDFDFATATDGYWYGCEDRRWLLGPDSMALVKLLNNEIQSGRITLKTHVLHISSDVLYWRLVQFPVFTGINDDLYAANYRPDDFYLAGSTVRGWDALPSAVAKRPPYILTQVAPPDWMRRETAGYDTIFHRGSLTLFRRRDLFIPE